MEAQGEKEMDATMAADLLGEGGVLQAGQEAQVTMASEEAQASFAEYLAKAAGGKSEKITPKKIGATTGADELVPKTPLEYGP